MYLISDGGIKANIPDTIEAIMLTKNLNYLDGVKIDVRLSLDKVFVLSKYNDLSKLTYSKYKVNEKNYNYLRKIKFPSHIFKYFIPTLEEVLKDYDQNKIIVLEIYDNDNFNNLFNLLVNYSYKYYFISHDKSILENLNNYNFNSIGKIIDDNSNIEIIKSITKDDINDNTLLIIEK